MYLGYFVTILGYVLENPSLWNVAVMTGATAAQLVRISCEEEVLVRDEVYGKISATAFASGSSRTSISADCGARIRT